MKIVADKDIPALAEGVASLLPEARLATLDGRLITPEDVAGADALIVRTRTRCDASLLAGSGVRLVGSATIGTDHLDIPWLEEAGIKWVNAPGCNAPAVMQYVAPSLALAGFDPSVHTLGVVGKGNIGSLVTRLYRDAGGRVLVCDPPRQEAAFADEDYLPLSSLVQECDALTFHVPYTASGPHPTRHLLSGPLPGSLKTVVNASRGRVVDPAIIDTSRNFIIDTWPFEDEPGQWSAAEIERLVRSAFIATPHIAGYSVEGKGRATRAMLDALLAFASDGDTPSAGEDTDAQAEAPRYSLPEVVASFNPLPLSEALKADPSAFERMRAAHLRPEARPL